MYLAPSKPCLFCKHNLVGVLRIAATIQDSVRKNRSN